MKMQKFIYSQSILNALLVPRFRVLRGWHL
uniref:Uncharacterized protein n=1 Tax=Arundo donax TaxID=35708 RepID=A0A0A9BSX4_ARUDO